MPVKASPQNVFVSGFKTTSKQPNTHKQDVRGVIDACCKNLLTAGKPAFHPPQRVFLVM